jgi:hypothetical protein
MSITVKQLREALANIEDKNGSDIIEVQMPDGKCISVIGIETKHSVMPRLGDKRKTVGVDEKSSVVILVEKEEEGL